MFPRNRTERLGRAKYRNVTEHYDGMKTEESNKIIKKVDEISFWRTLPFVLLVAFAIFVIIYLGGH